MESFDIIQKYFKLMKEEKNFNYKYNAIINSTKSPTLLLNKSNNENKKYNSFNKKIIIRNKNSKNDILNKKSLNKKIFIKTSQSKLNLKEKIIVPSPIKNIQIFKGKTQYNIKGFYIKSHCPFCKKILTEKEKESTTDTNNSFDNNIKNIYRNKKFKDIKSCFIYSVNNFPLINPKNIRISNKNYFKEKLNEEMKEKYNVPTKFKNKRLKMESELTKSNRIIKFKEIQRKEIDPSNLYLIKKPLIPSIRGKILKYTKKRIEKPMRMILIDEKEAEPFYFGDY